VTLAVVQGQTFAVDVPTWNIIILDDRFGFS